MKPTRFPENIITRSPRGTKKSFSSIATRNGSLPAQEQRNAFKKYIAEQEAMAAGSQENKPGA